MFLIVGLLLISPIRAQAALYAPGATLDPSCLPTDPACGIASSTASIGAGVQGQIPYYAGTGSAVTATSSLQIIQSGGVSVAGALSVGDATTTLANLGLSYASNSTIAASSHIAAWGDSLTQATAGNTPYTTPLAQLTGYSVYNGGIGGQTSGQIEARMVADTSKYSWPTIIWAGRNDGCSISTAESNIALMVAALNSVGNNNYLVISDINETTEGTGTGAYTCITQMNSDLAATYGAHFVDVRSYLVSLYDPNQAQDVIDHTNDTPPTSLRASGDLLHLNSMGYQDVASDIYQHFSELQPANSMFTLTPSNVLSLFASPPTIGSTTPGAAYFSRIAIGTSTNPSALTIDAGGVQNANAITFSGLQVANNTILSLKNNVNGLGWSIRSAGGSQDLFNIADPYLTNVLQINTGSSSIPSYCAPLSTTKIFSFGSTTVSTAVASKVAISGTNTNSSSPPLLNFIDLSSGPNILGVRSASGNAGWTISASGGSDEIFNLAGVTAASPPVTLSIYTGASAFNSYWKPQSSTSKFGFGTTTPYAKLAVWGPDTLAGTPAFMISNSASNTEFQVFDDGSATLFGALSQSSDRRLKTNIQPLNASSSLAAIQALNPVTFNWIDPSENPRQQLGFIAQDVQQIFPQLTSTTSATTLTPGGTLDLNYMGLIAPLVEAVKELASEVTGFAQSVTTAVLNATTVNTNTLCIKKADGTNVCITGDQLGSLLNQGGVSPEVPMVPVTDVASSTSSDASTTDTDSSTATSTNPDDSVPTPTPPASSTPDSTATSTS
jgi:hypothetical protein